MGRFWRDTIGTDEFWARFELADRLEDDGRYPELLALTDQLLVDCTAFMPPFGEHLSRVHRHRLVALGELGRGQEAWAHFGVVLPQFLAAPQAGDSVRVLRHAMGGILLRLGHDGPAQELFALALTDCQATASPADVMDLETLILASEVNAGRYAEAERRLDALASRLAVAQIPEEQRARLRAVVPWLGVVVRNGQERFSDAERMSVQAVAACVAFEGPGGEMGRGARLARARALVGLGRAHEAETECRMVLDHEIDVDEPAFGAQLCVLRTVLGRAFTVQRRHDQAVADLDAAVADGCRSLGASDPLTLDAVLALVAARRARGGADDADEALRLLETAVREGEAGPDSGHPLVREAREQLAELTSRAEAEAAAPQRAPERPWKARVQPGLRPCWDCGGTIWHDHK
ncbi:hypothetical protein [Yinghuangia sp. YIM S09857]|uniref:hypothetical protein n=1 Tax=Yinghuangia sp. YIM S09857 TaxID=3436929 RepID=UPI003F53239D